MRPRRGRRGLGRNAHGRSLGALAMAKGNYRDRKQAKKPKKDKKAKGTEAK